MKTYVAVLALMLTFGLFAQTSKPKHDLGIRISSIESERFQLNYRFHKNEKWTYTASGYWGIYRTGFMNGQYVLPDSTFEITTSMHQRNSFGLNLGMQRKLNFMKHNFYYVGASVGAGTTAYNSEFRRSLYETEEGSAGQGMYPVLTEEIESESFGSIYNSMSIKSRLYVGADVPVLDRLTLNFELGIIADLELFNTHKFNFFGTPGYLTAGLRYNFGKLNKE